MSAWILSRRLRHALVIGFAAALLSTVGAEAQQSAAQVCADVAKKAALPAWESIRKAAEVAYCRKKWMLNQPDELMACGSPEIAAGLAADLKTRMDTHFNGNRAAAVLNPAGLGTAWRTGRSARGQSRAYFGMGQALNRTTVSVQKTSGGAATLTVCAMDLRGKVVASARRDLAANSGQSVTQSVPIDNKNRARLVAAVVSVRDGAVDFKVRVTNRPSADSQRHVRGSADLHVHQMADLAFGGRLYWGRHDGPEEQALAKEIISGDIQPKMRLGEIDLPGTMGLLTKKLTGKAVDSNITLYTSKTPPDDEGFVTLGTAGYPNFEHWPHHADRSHQQAYSKWLEQAVKRNRGAGQNLSLMVASAVNNDILCKVFKILDPNGNVAKYSANGRRSGWLSANYGCTDWENLNRQIDAIHEMDRKYDWYRVALNPWHARQIIRQGSLAVVISLESDKPLSNSSGKYDNWVGTLDHYRERGVTTLQIVHESDSPFCGAAQHRNEMKSLQALHWLGKASLDLLRQGSVFDLDKGTGWNNLGITGKGKSLVKAMVERNMPIDIAHGSVRCRRAVFAEVPQDYGVYDSHTKFEKLMRPSPGQKDYGNHVLNREKTFLILKEIEKEYLDNKVLIGLRPTAIDVYDAPNARVDNTCPGSARSFAQLIQYAHDQGFMFAYGTDFNTGVAQLGPRFGKERCYASRKDLKYEFQTKRPVETPAPPLPARARQVKPIAGTNYYEDGMATIGWLPELSYDLQELLKTPGAKTLNEGAELYMAMWKRAYNYGPPKAVAAGGGARALGAQCDRNSDCNTNNCEGQTGGGSTGRKICVCKKDGDCPGRQLCASPFGGQNFCVADGAALLGQVCFTDKMCGSGKCSAIDGREGACVCNDNGDCANQEFCNNNTLVPAKNRCLPFRVLAQGAECYSDKSCISGRCSAIDGKKGECVCLENSHCGNKEFCQSNTALPTKNQCLPLGTVAMGGACRSDKSCKEGKCSAIDGTWGACVCKNDNDCGSGKWCDMGLDLNRNSCKAKLANGKICGKVGDLKVGHRCKSGNCKVNLLKSRTNLYCKK